MFSDEKIYRSKLTSKPRVKRFKGERYNPENMVNHTNISNIKINLWGYMQYDVGVRVFRVDEESFTGPLYLQCLIENLDGVDMTNTVFMQDNAPIHTTPEVMAYFRTSRWKTLTHPASSPDMNPLENVWHLGDRFLNHHLLTHFVNRKTDLFNLMREFLESIPISMVNSLIDGMPNRVRDLKNNFGGHTRY